MRSSTLDHQGRTNPPASASAEAEAMGKNTGAVKALQYRATRSLARIVPADLR